MTRTWTPRRAAERLDRAVEGVAPADAADRDLMVVVSALRSAPEVAPRPAHVAELRERLLDEADRLAAAAHATAAGTPAADPAEQRLRLPARTARAPRRRLTVAVGTLTALGVSASVGVAAQTALPGDSLYPIKRALESAQVGVTPDQGARGRLLLSNASDRLDETLTVLRDPDEASVSQVSATLDSFSREAGNASTLLLEEYARTGDRDLVDGLRTFTARSTGELGEMQPIMPASGVAAWDRANAAVVAIDTDALSACPLCAADLQRLAADVPTRTPDFEAGAEVPSATTTDGGRTDAGGDRSGGGDQPSGTRRPEQGGDRRGGSAGTPTPTAPGGDEGDGPTGGGTGTDGGLLGGLDEGLGGLTGDRTSGLGGGVAGGLLGGGSDDGGSTKGSGGGSGSGQKSGGRKGSSGSEGPVDDLLGGLLP